MKKIIFVALMSLVMFNSCTKCGTDIKDAEPVEIASTEFKVFNTVSSDKEFMFLNQGDNYRWYETCVLMQDFLDEETDGSVDEVVNVFQAIKDYGKSFDTKVFKFQHFVNGEFVADSIDGFWIEDYPLNDSLEHKYLSYEEAFELVMRTNFPKPHTKNAILRNPIGPKAINPQWVFGNINEQLWVDAVTGDISTSNPAFEGFNIPLGEWP